MRLIRKEPSEVSLGDVTVTTLLAEVQFESESHSGRLVEEPNMHGDEEFVKLVVNNKLENDTDPMSTLTIIRQYHDVEGSQRSEFDTYQVLFTEDKKLYIATEDRLKDSALQTVFPYMSEWYQELLEEALKALAILQEQESLSLSESMSVSASLSVSESVSTEVSLSESLSTVESVSASISESVRSSLLDSLNTTVSESLSQSESAYTSEIAESMSKYTSFIIDSVSMHFSEVQSEVASHLESLSASVENSMAIHQDIVRMRVADSLNAEVDRISGVVGSIVRDSANAYIEGSLGDDLVDEILGELDSELGNTLEGVSASGVSASAGSSWSADSLSVEDEPVRVKVITVDSDGEVEPADGSSFNPPSWYEDDEEATGILEEDSDEVESVDSGSADYDDEATGILEEEEEEGFRIPVSFGSSSKPSKPKVERKVDLESMSESEREVWEEVEAIRGGLNKEPDVGDDFNYSNFRSGLRSFKTGTLPHAEEAKVSLGEKPKKKGFFGRLKDSITKDYTEELYQQGSEQHNFVDLPSPGTVSLGGQKTEVNFFHSGEGVNIPSALKGSSVVKKQFEISDGSALVQFDEVEK